jgi:glycine cleavage system regulatory protein
MATLVLTVIGDDRSGLVSALSGVIAAHGGSWERSQMARLAGKFAGIVLVAVPDDRADELIRELQPLRADGLLDVTAERSDAPDDLSGATRLALELVGADRPGIVHDVSRALATRGVSIEELQTATREAPMSGDLLFEARATLLAPSSVAIADLREVLEQLANELMVDIALSTD